MVLRNGLDLMKRILPSISTCILTAAALLLVASISIAPNASRKPVLSADGSEILSAEGRVLTEFDTAGYLQSNWFGFTLLTIACVLLLLAAVLFALKLKGGLRIPHGG